MTKSNRNVMSDSTPIRVRGTLTATSQTNLALQPKIHEKAPRFIQENRGWIIPSRGCLWNLVKES
jgi:hypothetical protein